MHNPNFLQLKKFRNLPGGTCHVLWPVSIIMFLVLYKEYFKIFIFTCTIVWYLLNTL